MFSRRSVHTALKAWSDPARLGEHALAGLACVAAQRQTAGYPDTPAGRGLALRDVLRQALDSLRPAPAEPDPADPEWRAFLIISRRFLHRRSVDQVAELLAVAHSTLLHEQARALERSAAALEQLEAQAAERAAQRAAAQPGGPGGTGGAPAPFLAPPRPAEPLVARESLLTGLRARLRPGAVVALHGLPGAGKTALAIALTHDAELLARYPDGVLWAALGPRPNVLALLSTWGTALGVAGERVAGALTVAGRAQLVHAAIGLRRMLLVVDDAWELEEALAFRAGGPHSALLVTTRLPRLAVGLAGDGALAVPELDDAEGLALLEQLAPGLCAAHASEARALVRAVGALPLSLSLMGRYLRQEAYGGQWRRLAAAVTQLQQAERRIRLEQPEAPAAAGPALPAGGRLSALAAIRVSDEALPASARRAFSRLAVFPAKPNTFSEPAAIAVAATAPETLDALVDAGLLESAGGGRYRLHQTITDYARLLWDDGTRRAAEEALVVWAEGYLAAHAGAAELLEHGLPNLLAALDAAHARELRAAQLRLAVGLFDALQPRGLYGVLRPHLAQAVNAAGELGDHRGLVASLFRLGRCEYKLGNYVVAEEHFRAGLALAEADRDEAERMNLLHSLGVLVAKRGALGESQRFLDDGLALARRTGDSRRECDFLRSLGLLELGRGEVAGAERRLRASLALARANGYGDVLAVVLALLGAAAIYRGDYAQAEGYLSEGLASARASGASDIGLALATLGWSTGQRGDVARAEALLQEGLTLARQIGQREMISFVLANLGRVMARAGAFERAESYYAEALAHARAIGHQWAVCYVLNAWGELQLQCRALAPAAETFGEALGIARAMGSGDLEAGALYGLARTAYARGDPREAARLGRESHAQYAALEHSREADVARWLEQLQEPQLNADKR